MSRENPFKSSEKKGIEEAQSKYEKENEVERPGLKEPLPPGEMYTRENYEHLIRLGVQRLKDLERADTLRIKAEAPLDQKLFNEINRVRTEIKQNREKLIKEYEADIAEAQEHIKALRGIGAIAKTKEVEAGIKKLEAKKKTI